MLDLANYSIETDNVVLLEFKDGSTTRVAYSKLPKFLNPKDLQKVRQAFKVRQNFLRNHLPKTLLFTAAAGLAAFMVMDDSPLAHVIGGQPGQTESIRAEQVQRILPAPTPAQTPVSTVSSSPNASNAFASPASSPAGAPPAEVHASDTAKAILEANPVVSQLQIPILGSGTQKASRLNAKSGK